MLSFGLAGVGVGDGGEGRGGGKVGVGWEFVKNQQYEFCERSRHTGPYFARNPER